MNRTLIYAWVEREFDTVSWPLEMVDKLMPLLARVWEEGWVACKPEDHEPDRDPPVNPYGEPTDYAKPGSL